MPEISVVVPSYRQGRYLDRCLASVRAQDGVEVELIVLDACSTDDTPAVLDRWADRIDRLVVEPDDGQSDAIGRGIDRAAAPIVTWLNADDAYAAPDALRTLVDWLDRRDDVDLVYGRRAWIDGDGRFLRLDRWQPFDEAVLRLACYLPQECAVFRRAAYERAGGIDRGLSFALDYDLWLRMLATGSRFLSVPTVVGLFRVHAEQKTSARWQEVGLVEIGQLHHRELGREVSEAEMMAAADAHRDGVRRGSSEGAKRLRRDLAAILDGHLATVLGRGPLDRWALPDAASA